MALENCPQCGESISDKAPRCVHCGWERPLDKEEPEPKTCPECGEVLGDEATECPKCGCPIEKEPEEESPAKVELTSVKLNKKTKKYAIAAVVAIAVVACLIGAGILVSNQKAQQEAENSYNEYVSNLRAASLKMLSGASTAETTCNTVKSIWHSAIYNGKNKSKWDSDIKKYYNSDFSTAIQSYYSDSTGTKAVSTIKSNQSEVSEYMKKLNNPPEKLKTAYATLSTMYDSYSKLTDLAVSPSGNYSEYSSNVNDADTDFATNYEKLDTQIPDSSSE